MTEFFAKPIFHGPRFDSHMLPVELLRELQAYQEAIVQLAAMLWHEEHPGRARLPRGFGAEFHLAIRAIDDKAGCTGVELHRQRAPAQTSVGGDYYEKGRELLSQMIGDVASGEGRPRPISARARNALARLGSTLRPGESIVFASTPGARSGVRFLPEYARRLAARSRPQEDDVEVVGVYDSRSVRGRRIGVVQGSRVITCQAEPDKIGEWNAFLDHKVRVRGRGLVNDDDEVLEVTETHEVSLAEAASLDLQFARLRRLEAGWYDGEGEPLDRAMLERFEALLRQLEAAGIPRPSLYPTEDGEARAEWSNAPFEISVIASPVDPVLLEVHDREHDSWEEIRVDPGAPDAVDILVARLEPLLGEREEDGRDDAH